jgi:hypothetical protein
MPSKRSRKAPQRGGRPNHLTPQIAKRVCAAVRKGRPLKVAAGLAGVPYRTVKEWLQKGQRDGAEEPYLSFADDVERTRAIAADRLIGRLLNPKGNSKKQRVLAHVFERLYPSLFDPDHATRLLERQKLRAELSKEDQSGDVEVVVDCEPEPPAGETALAPHVAPGADVPRA